MPPTLPLAPPSLADATPCLTCAAGCCRHFELVIDGHDAYRLHRDLALPLDAFVELVAVDEDEPPRLLLDPISNVLCRLTLRRVSDPGPHRRRCVFLLPLGDHARCGAYDSRPAMCRLYPSTFVDDRPALAPGPHCLAGPWRLDQASARLASWHRLARRKRSLFRLVASTWNSWLAPQRRRPGGELLFAFLIDAYASLDQAHPAWSSPDFDADISPESAAALLARALPPLPR